MRSIWKLSLDSCAIYAAEETGSTTNSLAFSLKLLHVLARNEFRSHAFQLPATNALDMLKGISLANKLSMPDVVPISSLVFIFVLLVDNEFISTYSITVCFGSTYST